MKYWVAILITLGAGAATAGEPEAAFRVEEGWVRFTVTRDDQGVPAVGVRVIDRPGAPYVEGEADETGVGIFPVPASPDCVVTLTIAGKEADPILLRFSDRQSRVEPARVLITFDRRPCCQLSKVRPTAGADSDGNWLLAAELLVGVVCLAGGGWLYWTRPASREA